MQGGDLESWEVWGWDQASYELEPTAGETQRVNVIEGKKIA